MKKISIDTHFIKYRINRFIDKNTLKWCLKTCSLFFKFYKNNKFLKNNIWGEYLKYVFSLQLKSAYAYTLKVF